jgi:hypothetical protein
MLDVSPFKQITEFEEAEKVVYFNRESKDDNRTTRYRVEAMHDHRGKYSALVYRQLDVIVQPSEIADSKRLQPQHVTIWIRDDAPWTERDSADDAIKQLLSLWDA